MGLGLLLLAPVVAVQAMPTSVEVPATSAASALTDSAASTSGTSPAELAPSSTNAFVAIAQATTAREQAERHRAVVADRADRTKKRIARAKAVARDRAARVKARKAQARKWTAPTASGNVTGSFGASGSQWASGRHTGCDFDGNTGDSVRAVHTGVVVFAGDDGRYGKHVKIRHSSGDETWYAHLSSINVKVGQKVITRDRIGRVGQTGNAFGPHLHFEVHIDGAKEASNPVSYLRDKGVDL
jgi:murein DD-endopeptidase MepM/ murein hydrolase activator NlpD